MDGAGAALAGSFAGLPQDTKAIVMTRYIKEIERMPESTKKARFFLLKTDL